MSPESDARRNGVCPVKSTQEISLSEVTHRRMGVYSLVRAFTSAPRASSVLNSSSAAVAIYIRVPRPARLSQIANLHRGPQRRASPPIRRVHARALIEQKPGDVEMWRS